MARRNMGPAYERWCTEVNALGYRPGPLTEGSIGSPYLEWVGSTLVSRDRRSDLCKISHIIFCHRRKAV